MNTVNFCNDEENYDYCELINLKNYLKEKELCPVIKDIEEITDNSGNYFIYIYCYNNITIVIS